MNFSAISGGGFVELSWDPPIFDGGISMDNFTIYRGEEEDTLSPIISLNPDILNYNDTSVENGRRFYYAVTAFNLKGESDNGSIVIGKPMGLPSAPMNLTLLSGDEFVRISWELPDSDGGSKINGFRIHRKDAENEWNIIGTSTPYRLTYNDTDVENGRDYQYKVSAFNIVGESYQSDPVEASPAGIPDVVEDITVEYGDGFVEVEWSEPLWDGGSPVTGFILLRSVDYSDYSPLVETGPLERTYEDTTVENGRTYSYAVLAVNKMGPSLRISTDPVVPFGKPSAPIDLALERTLSYIELTWKDPASDGGDSVEYYNIYRYQSGGSFGIIEEVYPPVNEYKDPLVEKGKEYRYRITAVNGGGESQVSNEVFTTFSGTPYSPQNVVLKTKGSGVEIRWDPPENNGGEEITGYKIYRTESEGVTRLIATKGADSTGYLDEGGSGGERYSYFVRAVNSLGDGDGSESVEIQFPESGNSDFPLLLVLSILLTIILLIAIGILAYLSLGGKERRSGIDTGESDGEKQEADLDNKVDVEYSQPSEDISE